MFVFGHTCFINIFLIWKFKGTAQFILGQATLEPDWLEPFCSCGDKICEIATSSSPNSLHQEEVRIELVIVEVDETQLIAEHVHGDVNSKADERF